MKKSLIAILFICLLTTVVPGQEHEGLKLEPHLFKARSGQEVQAEKGSFYVPENRNKKNGKQIRLGFIRFKSTNPKPGYPIVYLAGGPGGSGSGTAMGRRFEIFMALREVADVIIENAGHNLFFSSPLIKQQMIDFFNGKKVTKTRLTAKPVEFK